MLRQSAVMPAEEEDVAVEVERRISRPGVQDAVVGDADRTFAGLRKGALGYLGDGEILSADMSPRQSSRFTTTR